MAREYIKCELHVIGVGAIGFSVGNAFLETNPGKSCCRLERESNSRKFK